MVLSEYFRVIGCRLIIACYVGKSVRKLFSKYPITPKKDTPICLNHIVSGRRLGKITQAMSYTNFPIPEYDDFLFQHRHMEEGWNSNMAAQFDSWWLIILNKSIQEWVNFYMLPGLIFVLCKPPPLVTSTTTLCMHYPRLSKVLR